MTGRVRNGLFVEYCAKDFLDGTLTLGPWEELAYRRVVDMIYATNDRLADDDRHLAWATKTGRRWPGLRRALMAAGKLEVIDGRLSNPRCRLELAKSARKIAQKALAGRASIAIRKSLNNNETAATAVGTAGLAAGPPTTDPDPTTNPESTIQRESPGARGESPAPARPAGGVMTDDWRLPGAWRDFALAQGLTPAATAWEADKFRDYWLAKPGRDACRSDWFAAWRNWVRRTHDFPRRDQSDQRRNDRGGRGGASALVAGFAEAAADRTGDDPDQR